MRAVVLSTTVVLALQISACGTSNVADQTAIPVDSTPKEATSTATSTPATTSTAAQTTTTQATTPQPATTAATTPASPGGAQSGGETSNGGATPEGPAAGGDEQGTRVPAAYAIAGQDVTPARITVPPFLPVALTLHTADGFAHTFTLQTPTPVTIRVPAGKTISQRIDGLKAGDYAIVIDGGQTAGHLLVADDTGP